MNENKYIQSALARAILDESYLHRLEKKKPATRVFSGNARLLSSIRRFSAFISKVQHNFLAADYPVTLYLLHKYRFANAFFSEYLSTHQQLKKNKATNHEKEKAFVDFLTTHLEQKAATRYRYVLDALRHESIVKKLKLQQQPESVFKDRGKNPFSKTRPMRVNGNFEIIILYSNPASVSLSPRVNRRLGYSARGKTYCYWHAPGAEEVTIFELDGHLQFVLSLINNKSSITAIASLLEDNASSEAISTIFKMLYDMDFILFN